jgi:hypothetical protein
MNNGTYTYFFNALEDPWQAAGVLNVTTEQTARNMKNYYVNCPNCGHCIDLHSDTNSDADVLTQGRQDAWTTIKAWLIAQQGQKEKDIEFLQN